MNVPDKVPFHLTDKPNLQKLMKEQPEKAKEIMAAFGAMMESAAENEWQELPQLFGQGKVKLTFADLVRGILHGALDLPAMNPEMYDVLKEEVHPLSMIAPRKNLLTGSTKYRNWRLHYGLDESTPLTAETIATIIRKSLRYYRYVDIDSLAKSLINNQVANWRGLENPHMLANLPFVPALRYQQEKLGDLYVGRFWDEVGSFECGYWNKNHTNCPACGHDSIHDLDIYKICADCNGGWKVEAD